MTAVQPAPDPTPAAGAPFGDPRLRRLGATLLLAAAAALGNYFSMTLFFGVEVLFGSVAALLAVARLGTVPGIVVAGIGGSYTLVLWHHPFALIIFVLEVTAIGLHRDCAARRGEPAPPLAVSAALYWLLLGIPLVLLFYHGPLGLGWLPTGLVAAKQAVNGILNAALASALLLAGALLRAHRGLPRLDELLFSMLLTAALVPALVITAWENSDLKDWQEREAAANLRMFGSVALDRLAQASGPEPLADALARVGDIARERLHSGAAPRLVIADRQNGAPMLGDAAPAGDVIESAVPGMLLVLPAAPTSSAMQRWRATRYRIALPADEVAAGHDLVIEISAEPVIDLVQQRLLRPLVALFLLALAAVLLARTLSRRIVAPLDDQARVARALPTALREGSAPPLATPGLFAESVDFSSAVNAMGASLRQSFAALAAERDEQARGRALLDLEAHVLSRLVRHGDDAAGFATELCRQVRRALPGRRCLLELPMGDATAPAERPGMHALEVRGRDGDTLGLLLTDLPASERDAGFAGEVLHRALTLAELGLAAIALRRRHEVLLEALSQTGTGIVIAARRGRDHVVSYANRGFETLTGYPAAELMGCNPRMLRDGDADQPDLDEMRAALADGRPCRVVIRNRRRDGSRYWTSLALSPVHDHRGHLTHYLGVQQDVTETVATVERLRISEAQLTEAQAIARIGSWEWDIGTGALAWSDETYRVLGYVQGAVTPTFERFLAVVHADDRDRVHAAIAAALQHPDGHYEAEFRVRGPNGAELIAHSRGRVHFDADGRPLRIAGTAQDITEQRRMERALRAEQERYRMVVEHLEDLLVRVDADGRFEFVSPSYCRLFGKTEAELIGHTFMPLVHPEDRAATAAAMERLFAPPHTATMEQRVETVRGERWLQWSDRAVLDAAGQVVGVVGLGRDITERKAAEQALRASEQHFRALFETIGEGVVYYDAQGRVTDVNPAGAAMMGFPRAALIGRLPDDMTGRLIAEDGTQLRVDEYPSRIALRTGRSTEPRVLGLAIGETVRWGLVQAHVETLPGADRPQQVFVTFADITSLLETRQRLQAIVDSSPHGIVAVDVASREIRWCNEAMQQLFGYSRDELIGLSIAALYPQDASAVLVDEADLDDDLEPGSLGLLAYVPCRRRDGSRFYCDVAPGLARLGSARIMTAFFSDATLEYESRRALEQSRRALLDAQALSHIGSWEYDSARDRLTWSPEVYRIFEQDESAFGASFEAFQRVVHPEDRAHLAEAYRTAEAALSEYDLVHRLLLPDERVKWVHERARFVRDGTGGALLARGTVQDITEQRLAELALAERETMLRELLSLAADCVDADDTDIERISGCALARIGALFGADRAYLFDFDPGADVYSMPLEWTAEGIAPSIDACRALPLPGIPNISATFARHEPIVIANVDAMPPEWAPERTLFVSQDIQSLLAAPLFSAGALRGAIGFDSVRAPRTWRDVEVHFLQVFANILASARERAKVLAALRVTNARYEDVSQQSRTMAWEVDTDGRYTYVNSASLTVFGEPPEALPGRHCTELLHPDGDAELAAAQDLIRRGEPLENFINPGRRRDGSKVWVLTNGVPIHDADGRVAGYRGTDKDITEQYLAEQELKASRARLAAVFDNAPIGMALLDAERRLVLVNRALAALVGEHVETLTGRSADDVTHPDDLHLSRRRFDDLLAGRCDGIRVTRRFLRPDGHVVWGDQRIVLLPTAPGDPPAPLAMVEDVTELHRAQEQRRKLETMLSSYTARLEELLDLVNLSLPAAEQLTALLKVARRALSMDSASVALVSPAGDKPPALMALSSDLPVPPPPLPARLLDAALAALGAPVAACEGLGAAAEAADLGCCVALALAGAGDSAPSAMRLLLVLWGRRNRLVLAQPVRQQLRLIAQRIAAVHLQAQMQQDLVQAKERESIGHLASGVAHDFNNLLGVIDANLFFLEDAVAALGRGDPELAQVLEETRSALSQAKVVTSGIMSLSRAGGVPLAEVRLAESIGELVGILRHVLPAGIALETEIRPGIRAWTNSAFLQSALLNLALNARDAMPGGGRLRIAAASLPLGRRRAAGGRPAGGGLCRGRGG
jgi:PAS domain S-box-containing protein